jgi:hypothetical protein
VFVPAVTAGVVALPFPSGVVAEARPGQLLREAAAAPVLTTLPKVRLLII